MRIGKIEVKRRVWVALASAVIVTALWLGWTRGRPPAAAQVTTAAPAYVRLAGAGAGQADMVLRERAELFDPTPLFFPTKWNYGQRPLPAGLRRQPGQVFGTFEPKLTVAEQGMKSYGVETTPAPEKLSDVLVQGNEAPFAGMGEVDVPRTPLAERAGYLEVRGFIDDKLILEQELNGIDVPRHDFAPIEFLAVVSTAGLVGEPVLASGSGREEVDAFFRSYLVKTYRLGERLNPGRYRVLVGP